eukprot:1178570-Prorocentrum_minimum.AAC.1
MRTGGLEAAGRGGTVPRVQRLKGMALACTHGCHRNNDTSRCLIGRLYLPTSQRELTLKLVHLLEDMFNGKEVASLDHGFNRTRSQSVIAYNKEHTRYKASDLLTAENVYKQLQTSKSAH